MMNAVLLEAVACRLLVADCGCCCSSALQGYDRKESHQHNKLKCPDADCRRPTADGILVPKDTPLIDYLKMSLSTLE